VTRAIKAVNTSLHYLAGALIVGVVVITVYNVIGRWLFDAPLQGTVELTELAMVGIVYLGMAYAQQQDGHITVDLLYQRLGPRWRSVLDAFAAIVGVVVVTLIAWRLYAYAEVLEIGGRTTASRQIPLYPFAYLAIVGLTAYGLALATTFVRRLRDAARREEERRDEPPEPEPTRQATL
jgi:TRAP-type C4-dicarboxylate transport system permease small subunit